MRSFRPGASLPPLAVWTWVAGCFAILMFTQAGPPRHTDDRLIAAIVGTLPVLGALSFAIHLVRRFLVRITVHPALGLILNHQPAVPWTEFRRVEQSNGRIRLLVSLLTRVTVRKVAWWQGGILIAAMAIGLLLYFAALPVTSLIPFLDSTVTLTREGDGAVVLRDLYGESEFVEAASRCIRLRVEWTGP